ncbi:MAG: hypothetical protein Q8M92_04480, partial [Candidatus Subteraquimicrobiales bacterium]|nr:hypothetical protein [Candidatus Subteraquimicrobiales bacterium]
MSTNTKDVKKRVIIMTRARMSRVGLLTVLLSTLLVLIPVGYVLAISGVCSNCHTMHNSQGGIRMADKDAPYDYLLMASCLGCHTGPVVTDRKNSFGAPIVLGTVDPGGQGGTFTLAGGDFWWVKNAASAPDSKGHNVYGIAGVDGAAFGKNPPGWDPAATPGALGDGQINAGASTWATQLNCAGQFGCHGNHSSATNDGGIFGAHHGNTGGTATRAGESSAPTTVGSSFRFLGGIRGLEQSQWNWNETDSSHNEYYGVNDTANRNQTYTTYTNKDTISFSCAQCHGFFHSRIDDITIPPSTGTPWLRHPTDIVLPGGETEYASYVVYSVEAPVGRSTVPATSGGTVVPGT